MTPAPRLAAAALTALLLSACATGQAPDPRMPNSRDGQIITQERIQKSGAVNGYEALRYAGTHLSFQQAREGSPDRVTHRGVDSFYLSSDIMLVVDGAQMRSLEALKSIPANNILYIQVLPARVGVVRYGTGGGNGVVVVQTDVPESADPGAAKRVAGRF